MIDHPGHIHWLQNGWAAAWDVPHPMIGRISMASDPGQHKHLCIHLLRICQITTAYNMTRAPAASDIDISADSEDQKPKV